MKESPLNKKNSGAIIGDPFTFVIKISFLMSAVAQITDFCIKNCSFSPQHFLCFISGQSQTIRKLMPLWPVTGLVHAQSQLPPCPKFETPQLPPMAHAPTQAQCIWRVKMLHTQFQHLLRELTRATRCQAGKSEHEDW